MSSRRPSWELVQTFLAVMREGSLSGAARGLAIAQPTVRRHVEALEQLLGDVLFTRSVTGLTPTDAARRTLPYAEAMAATADALVRATSGSVNDATGTVRLTCSEVVGAEVLPLILAELLAAHPGLEVEIVPTNATQDLLRRDADLAVRMTPPTQMALVARRVGEIELGLHGSERYFATRHAPRTLSELAEGHILIGEDRGVAIDQHLRTLGPQTPKLRFAYRTDNNLAQLGAIRAGVGIGVCPTSLAGPGSQLRRVLPDIKIDLPTWIVMHEDLRTVRRVRLVFDHLVQAFTSYTRSRSEG